MFRVSGSSGTGVQVTGSGAYHIVDMSLNRVNSIFGSSDTVMPESINIPTIIYLGK